MSTVGIIANPASGRDIRRLVAHASVFDNLEKAHILRRVLLALDAIGVQRVIYMPDYGGLVDKALKGLKLSLKPVQLSMDMWADERDSTEAERCGLHHHSGSRRNKPRCSQGLQQRPHRRHFYRHEQRLPEHD
jgi:hypothetical protein